MNSFGNNFRVSIYGESHGAEVGVIIDGVPPGLAIATADFEAMLSRRRGGQHSAATPRKEADIPQFVSGVYNGFSTGAPLCIQFANTNTKSGDYDAIRQIPRPGHADFVAHHKYRGFEDYRGGGHFSARLTVGIVAAGRVAMMVLPPTVAIAARVVEIAGREDLEAGLAAATAANDSAGGIIECVVSHMPLGYGEPFWNSLESMLAHAMFAIPAVKGIEFGNGFAAARIFGSENNDGIINEKGTTATNNAGGINGGISNGNNLVFRIAIKPASSTPAMQSSWNSATGMVQDFSIVGRHDLCVALRAPVIVEAMAAIVLADLMKFAS